MKRYMDIVVCENICPILMNNLLMDHSEKTFHQEKENMPCQNALQVFS